MKTFFGALVLACLVGCGPMSPMDWILPGPPLFETAFEKNKCFRPGCTCKEPCPMKEDCKCGPDPSPEEIVGPHCEENNA